VVVFQRTIVANGLSFPFAVRSKRHSMVFPKLLKAANVCAAAGSVFAFGP
jgi:hypothetical protein